MIFGEFARRLKNKNQLLPPRRRVEKGKGEKSFGRSKKEGEKVEIGYE
jgi:hypothetical protein